MLVPQVPQHQTLSSSNQPQTRQRAVASEGMERIWSPTPPALHGDESGLPAVGPQPHPLLVQLPGKGQPPPPKKSPVRGAATLHSLGLFVCRKARCGWCPPRGHCPIPAPRQGLLLSLSEPHSPRSRVPLPPTWTHTQDWSPQKACGHLCLWQPVRG